MKRYIKVTFLIVFCTLLCCGCQGDITRAIRHEGFNVGDEFVCENFYPKDKKDTSYDKIKYLTGNQVIDENGKIYEISLSQKYANDSNCKAADTNIEVMAIFDNKIVKSSDGKLYNLNASNNVAAYSEVLNTDNYYELYNLLLGSDDTLKVITANSNTGLYYVLKNDGNVYEITVSKADRGQPLAIVSTTLVYNKNKFGSDIIDFNYAGDSGATYVKTDNTAYKMYVDNKADCTKYADVNCKYKMKEFETYAKYKDYIIAYNGNTIITSYKRVFSVT